jgi:xylitol oxidase
VQALVRRLPEAKALGARHSFNHIADTEGTQIDLGHLKAMHLDGEARTVTVGAGISYGELAPWLHTQGFAVHNLASLPHISIVGACASATHGSGIRNGCLSTAVSALELVTGEGELLHLSRASHPEVFAGAVVGLGALGVVTGITLQVVPTFQVAQMVYEDLSFSELEHNLRAIVSAGYSVSLFTDWQQHRATQAWVKRKLEDTSQPDFPATFFGASKQTAKLHPLPKHDATNCTEQLGVPGPWYDRLPHFRHDYTPSSGAELQTEYFVPLDRAYEAILAIEELRDSITPLLFVSEMRTIAADDLWMSMAYGQDSLAFHFTWKQQLPAVLGLLPHLEAKLAPFAARPHWSKLFTLPGEQLRRLYPRFHDFQALVARFDPKGRFRNEYLREVLET